MFVSNRRSPIGFSSDPVYNKVELLLPRKMVLLVLVGPKGHFLEAAKVEIESWSCDISGY